MELIRRSEKNHHGIHTLTLPPLLSPRLTVNLLERGPGVARTRRPGSKSQPHHPPSKAWGSWSLGLSVLEPRPIRRLKAGKNNLLSRRMSPVSTAPGLPLRPPPT